MSRNRRPAIIGASMKIDNAHVPTTQFDEFDGSTVSLRRMFSPRGDLYYQMVWGFVVHDEPMSVVAEFEKVLQEKSPEFLNKVLAEAKRRA